MPRLWPGTVVALASEAVIIALVLAGWRKTALAALVPAAVLLWPLWTPEFTPNVLSGWRVYLLEAVALIASPGPRHGHLPESSAHGWISAVDHTLRWLVHYLSNEPIQ
jgi:hypothetical protein